VVIYENRAFHEIDHLKTSNNLALLVILIVRYNEQRGIFFAIFFSYLLLWQHISSCRY